MAKISLADPKSSDSRVYTSLDSFAATMHATPPGTCPLTVQLSILRASMAQTCGKCVPCRDGLPQLAKLLEDLLDGKAEPGALEQMQALAAIIRDTSDCIIGWHTADEFLKGMETFRSEYESHLRDHRCLADTSQKVPCIHLCPAHVNVPGYIACIRAGDPAGAINLIRKDNPFPTACAMICEHPCEARCRRQLLDDAINIRGLKKYAVDQVAADKVAVPKANPATGRKIGIIGGGPAGLTAAYFLALMGHKVVVYEAQPKLGGMLRYGIPNYRFPKERLDEDIRAILSAGDITVHCGVKIGKDISIEEVRKEYDAMFVAIGAQKGKKLRIDGADAENVESAVEMLDRVAKGDIPDYTGQTVCVVGGGNVAIDIARTAIRCGAKDVRLVYRRRQEDMTAQASEIEAAGMEGVEIMTLQAPKSIEKDENGRAVALITQPQLVGAYDRGGRPAPVDANQPPLRIPCDRVILAIGQDIESKPFEDFGMPAERGVFRAGLDTAVQTMPGVFVGGDCATGPATVIRAIAAGKVAAYGIDEYLGYHHNLTCDVKIPPAWENERTQIGRANISERLACERKYDFEHVECTYNEQDAMQEAGRCLRCDHFGCGALESGHD